jgi:hypothetical protein
MRWCAIRTVLTALACSVFCLAGPVRAALVLTAPAQVAPGTSFDVTLSLTEAWPLGQGEVVDEVLITLTYGNTDPNGPAVLTLDVPPATAGVVLDVPGASPVLGELSTVSFTTALAPFGPGELLRYHFTALQDTAGQSAFITATVVPTMIDSQALAELAPAAASVQVVPEPSTWLLLAFGIAGLTVVRMRTPQLARASRRTR